MPTQGKFQAQIYAANQTFHCPSTIGALCKWLPHTNTLMPSLLNLKTMIKIFVQPNDIAGLSQPTLFNCQLKKKQKASRIMVGQSHKYKCFQIQKNDVPDLSAVNSCAFQLGEKPPRRSTAKYHTSVSEFNLCIFSCNLISGIRNFV